MLPGVGSSLVYQKLGLRFPTSDVQVRPLIVAPGARMTHSTEDKPPRFLVKATLSGSEPPEKLTPKSSNISRKVSVPVVSSMGWAQFQIWPYSNLYLFLKFTVTSKVIRLFLAQTPRGEDQGLLGLTCLCGLGRGEDMVATTGIFQGVSAAVETCWILLQSEVSHGLSQRN